MKRFFEKNKWVQDYLPQDAIGVSYSLEDAEVFNLVQYEVGQSNVSSQTSLVVFVAQDGDCVEGFPQKPVSTQFMRWKKRREAVAQSFVLRSISEAARELTSEEQRRVRYILWMKQDEDSFVELTVMRIPKRQTLAMMLEVAKSVHLGKLLNPGGERQGEVLQ